MFWSYDWPNPGIFQAIYRQAGGCGIADMDGRLGTVAKGRGGRRKGEGSDDGAGIDLYRRRWQDVVELCASENILDYQVLIAGKSGEVVISRTVEIHLDRREIAEFRIIRGGSEALQDQDVVACGATSHCVAVDRLQSHDVLA